MSSILMFSNRSVTLFTLKNRFLITAKVLHSIRMCLTVQVVWQVKHCGCGSCFKMKEWVSLAWPIRNQDITTCSLLDFLDAGLHSPKVGWIWKSLLWMLLLHCCCHLVWRNIWRMPKDISVETLGYNNKDEVNSPNILTNYYYQVSSQKFRQTVQPRFWKFPFICIHRKDNRTT